MPHNKLFIATSIVAFVLMGLALSSSAVDAAAPCKSKKFETQDVKAACEKGGQKAAKDAMKAFLKQAKKKQPSLTCESCHKSLAPKYPLTSDGLAKYKELGGI